MKVAASLRCTSHWLLGIAAIFIAVGCVAGEGRVGDTGGSNNNNNTETRGPVKIKEPPSPGRTETSPGCGGVTEAGECKDGIAVTCDVDADKVVSTDCKTLQKNC